MRKFYFYLGIIVILFLGLLMTADVKTVFSQDDDSNNHEPTPSPLPAPKDIPKEQPKKVLPAAMKIILQPEKTEFVGRDRIYIDGQILYLVGVKPDFDGLKNLKELGPFRIERVTIGEEQGGDYHIIPIKLTVFLAKEKDKGLGVYILPSFRVKYLDLTRREEFSVSSPPVILKKVPILVETRISKEAISIGDQINYYLEIKMEPEWKIVPEFIEQFSGVKQWGPLDSVSSGLKKEKEREDLKEFSFSIILAYYDRGNKKLEIPSYKIPFIKKGSQKIETRIAPAVFLKANSMIFKEKVQSIDGDIPTYSSAYVYAYTYGLIGLGSLIFTIFAVIWGRSGIKFIMAKERKETPRKARKRFKLFLKAAESKEDYADFLKELNRESRRYLAVLAGIDPGKADSVKFGKMICFRQEKIFKEGVVLLNDLEERLFSGMEPGKLSDFKKRARVLLNLKK